ncbi:MAG: HIT family protein [Aquihabitans sp.]
MATLFTQIIAGDIPGRFVWRDDTCVVFGTIAPLTPGHMLVVPRAEIDHWIDLDRADVAHLMGVAQIVGRAQMKAFAPTRVGLIIAGLEVPHTHLHVVPMASEADLSFARADHGASAESLDAAAELLRVALRSDGHPEVVDH